MDFFDLIKELRKKNADPGKAGKAMKILGWICIIGGIWNAVFEFIFPFDDSPFNFHPAYPYLALTCGITLGALFLISSRSIVEMKPSGKRMGQLAIALMVILLLTTFYFIIPADFIPEGSGISRVVIIIFAIVFLLQFGLPAYFGIRYLERLPVNHDNTDHRFTPEEQIKPIETHETISKKSGQYVDALLPFGILGTFLVLMLIGMTPFFLIMAFTKQDTFAFSFLPGFLFIFFTPILYNFFPSQFEKQRMVIAAFTGGGSINLFNGTWPFFRLFVYKDGIEIRVMLHRFFIPFDEMSPLPESLGFFNRGILIESSLEGVPSAIRYNGFGIKRVLNTINENRSNFVKNR